MTLTQISSRGVEDSLRWSLGQSGGNYRFTGPGLTGTVSDPTIYLSRGQTYIFENNSGGHPFYIKTSIANGGTNDAYNTGVTNNGGGDGTEIKFVVPHDAPDVLYYQCSSHATMAGTIYITGAVADGSISTAKIAADAVDGTKLADDAVNSEHYTDGSIDSVHYALGSVVSNIIADDAITTDKIADNLSFGGTAGITLPVGTTAQRPSNSAGILRYNSTTGEVEVSDGTNFRRITNPPEVSSISPTLVTNSEATITVTGIGFENGDIVKFVNSSTAAEVTASATSFTNATTLVATATITTDGTYKVQVVKADGRFGQTAAALLTVSDAPTWSTASGALTAGVSGTSYSTTLSASSDSTVTFALQSGSLPSGLSLNSTTGVLSGTPDATSSTNYSFTIRATDAESQTADRAFTLQVNVSRTLRFILHGARGDDAVEYNGTSYAGDGGVVQATMTFNTGTVLYIAVDQGSAENGNDQAGGYSGASGRYSGGYAGVFLNSIAHSNAQLIAGGGGNDCGFHGRIGGNGGANTGANATGSYAGSGGSQPAGGAGGGNGYAGSALQGGRGGHGDDSGGAGGGGYYGGGGGQGSGQTNCGSGGGGSNYVIASGTSNVTNQRGGGSGDGKVEIQDTSGNQLYLKNTTGTATYTVV